MTDAERLELVLEDGSYFPDPMVQLLRAECLRLREENKILSLKNRGSLANNLCPDHRGKQVGKPCLACTAESQRRHIVEMLLTEASNEGWDDMTRKTLLDATRMVEEMP